MSIGRIVQRMLSPVVPDEIEQLDRAVDTSTLTGWEVTGGVVVLCLTWPLALLVGRLVRRGLRKVDMPPHALELIVRIVRSTLLLIGLAASMTILGVDVGWFTVVIVFIVGVAALMARPMIENFAAGVLLETRTSFTVGDEIETNGQRGEVKLVNARTTIIETADLRRIHVPNTDVLDQTVVVFTGYERRRSQLEIEIAYRSDLDEVTATLIRAATDAEGVLSVPPPSVRFTGFGPGTCALSLRWWHAPDFAAESAARDQVVRRVKQHFDAASIQMPSPEVIVRQPDRGSAI